MNKRRRRKRQAIRRAMRRAAPQIDLADAKAIVLALSAFRLLGAFAHDPVRVLVAKGYDQKTIEAVVSDPRHPDRKIWETVAALNGLELPRAGDG